MAKLLTFPGSARVCAAPPEATLTALMARPVLPATGGRRGEYALADVARPLGLLHRPPRAIVETLRALAQHQGMPLPRTPRIVRGLPVSGPRSICQQSRWDAGEFDAWLETRGPSGPSAAAPVPVPVRQLMAERARQLGAA